MHELSIVSSVVDTVTESLAAYPGARVKEVRLRVGALASVVRESLEFCYGIAAEGTPLEGSRLVVNVLPVVMHCVPCGAGCGRWRAFRASAVPRCGEPCSDLRQGRELEIDSIEIEEAQRRRHDDQDCGAAARNSEKER
jgi:hydrogenase nickel incorporation protein HypA/HybF